MSWRKSRKSSLWSVTVSYFMHRVMINSVLGLEKKLQSNSQCQIFTQKRVLVTVGMLPFWSMTTFWILVKLLHLRNMLSKSMICTKNYNACCLALVNREGRVLLCNNVLLHNQCFKVEKLGYKVLPHLQYSPDLSPTDYHFVKILTTFCSENDSTTSKNQKMLSKSVQNSEVQVLFFGFFFFAAGKKLAYFLLAKLCWL